MTALRAGTAGETFSLSDAMRRFNAAEGGSTPAFNRRRVRMLQVGGWIMLIAAVPWACYFLWLDRLAPALFELAFVAISALLLLLLRQGLLRVASLVFTVGCVLGVIAQAITVDVATAGIPRTSHLFLIPITVAAFFLLQNEGPRIRLGIPGLTLAAFVFLAANPSNFGFEPPMDQESRLRAVAYVYGLTAVALYAVLVVMVREAKESTTLEREFTMAIANGEIEAYLQPQCAADGRITGAEALMRWRHPRRGYVSPLEFIPMAERSGLIIPAGAHVLLAVCQLLQRWAADPALRGVSVSVNISPAQLFSDEAAERLVDTVPQAVADSGVLKFELTESMFVRDFDQVRERMARIRARGIRIALDDFGTGFSSLNYLHQLPIDQLKVDRSFVKDLPEDVNAGKIAHTIIQLGRDLDLEVVAEGTETQAQVDALRAMGCAIFQGFLFSRPLPIEAFEQLARERHTPVVPLAEPA